MGKLGAVVLGLAVLAVVAAALLPLFRLAWERLAEYVRWALRPRSFTLIELLIVVATICILAAIVIPLYNNIRLRARCAQNSWAEECQSSPSSLVEMRCPNGIVVDGVRVRCL